MTRSRASIDAAGAQERVQMIVEYLSQHGTGVSAETVAAFFGITRRAMNSWLLPMRERGVIARSSRCGKGILWALPENMPATLAAARAAREKPARPKRVPWAYRTGHRFVCAANAPQMNVTAPATWCQQAIAA